MQYSKVKVSYVNISGQSNPGEGKLSTKIREMPSYNAGDASPQKPIGMAMAKKPSSRVADEPRTQSRHQPVTEYAGSVDTTTIQIEDTETSLANISVVDKQKVAQLRQAIREGTYRIDAERIADKLIALGHVLSK